MDKTVLVVEDDKGVQKLLADALEGEGFTVICEKDGNWALRTFENKPIDFILLDILIPVMNGFQLAERIRKHPKGPTVPIIMISGVYRAMSHRLEAIKKYNVVEYLDKPVKLDLLFSLMRQALGADYPRPEPAAAAAPEAPGGYTDTQSLTEREEVESQEGGVDINDLKGTIAGYPFPELLATLYQQRATGALLIKSAKIKKIIYFQDGRAIFVKSNLLNECLGRIMVSEKMITQEELEESVQRMKSSKRQQGTILIEMGCISPHNLVYALEKQLEVKLFDIFGWSDGEFQFNPKAAIETPITTLEISPSTLIYDGIKRRFDPARVENELLEFMNSYVTPNPDAKLRFQDMSMDDEEGALLQSFDEPQRLRDVIAGAIMPRDKLMRLIYALKATGIVLLTPTPGGEEAPPPLPAQPPPLPPPLKKGPPAAAPGIPIEEKEIIDRLLKRAAEYKQKNYFEVLGVPRTASAGDVKRAYFALAREHHPDRLPVTVSREVRRVAEELFQLMTTAQEVLSDPRRRDGYTKELSTGVKAGMSDEVTRILAAEGQFQQGETYLKKRMFAKAAECFKEAIDLYSDEAEFHCHFGWALFQSDPENRDAQKQAREAISAAISRNPKIDKSYLFLGYIYKATGRQDLAEQQFEKAIQCNPDCTDALRELRLLDMRRGQRPGQPPQKR